MISWQYEGSTAKLDHYLNAKAIVDGGWTVVLISLIRRGVERVSPDLSLFLIILPILKFVRQAKCSIRPLR